MKQSVFTKKMNFLAFTFFLMASTFSQLSFAAVAKLPQINFGTRSQTEGTICTDCAVRAPQSSLMGQLAQLNTGTERIFNAAYFSDNGERSTLVELRNRRARGEALTVEERAILQASDRIGLVYWPNCVNAETGRPASGTAILTRINGKDAIISPAHIIKDSSGNLYGNCNLEDYSNAQFMPNYSYYGQTGAASIGENEVFKSVDARVDNRLGDFSTNPTGQESDWIVMFLDQQISNEHISNTNIPRGFISFASPQIQRQSVSGYIIGLDSRQSPGYTTYQACNVVQDDNASFNSCDTSNGSSGSLIGILENGEIKMQGINTRNSAVLSESGEHSTPSNYRHWNYGISADHISNEIQRILNPQGTDV